MRSILVSLILLAAGPAFGASSIVNKPICVSVQTPAMGGTATVDVTVAGTFNGVDPDVSNGRFLRGIEVWTDVGAAGDRAYGFIINDSDGVIPAPARAAFANYPVIAYLYDEQVVEAGGVLRGMFIKPGTVMRLENPTGALTQFIPSGLHVVGTVYSTIQTMFRANFMIGKLQAQ